ncbi:MAG: hypothetical protein ACP5PJ_06140 [Acidimicrobiales bacterium]
MGTVRSVGLSVGYPDQDREVPAALFGDRLVFYLQQLTVLSTLGDV